MRPPYKRILHLTRTLRILHTHTRTCAGAWRFKEPSCSATTGLLDPPRQFSVPGPCLPVFGYADVAPTHPIQQRPPTLPVLCTQEGTLINSKSGIPFSRGLDDWKFFSKKVPGALKTLQAQGYKLVIFR